MTIDRRERENRVLEAIIRIHTETALPVGSGHISKMLSLSSATIRSVMSELEEQGYLYQPHTSAGRIPTDIGYRRYVNNITYERDKMLHNFIMQYIREREDELKKFESMAEAVSHLISEVTRYVGMALSPANKIYLDGESYILEHPEFRELNRVQNILKIFDEKEELLHILEENLEDEGIHIRIGRELEIDELRDCTIITSSYRRKKRPLGSLGIIGPMRMRYKKVVALVEELANVISEVLE